MLLPAWQELQRDRLRLTLSESANDAINKG
jgi:hypothetical protein